MSLLKSTAVAMLTGAIVFGTSAQPAHASVLSPLTTAYQYYLEYVQGQIALRAATQGIIGAIQGAKAEILVHIDQIAAADVQGCAEAAVIDSADMERMTTDTLQDFARDATSCVTSAKSLINVSSTDIGVVNELGFAINSVGPLALIARVRAGFSTSTLTTTLVAANNTLVTKLTAQPGTSAPGGHCSAHANTGDQPPGSLLEYIITCREFNGDTGTDSCWGCIVYTNAQRIAARNTSRPVAIAALDELT